MKPKKIIARYAASGLMFNVHMFPTQFHDAHPKDSLPSSNQNMAGNQESAQYNDFPSYKPP